MDKNFILQMQVSDKLLELIEMAKQEDICTSDLQGICEFEAMKLIEKIRGIK